MADAGPRRRSPFTRWQWAELWALVVVVVAQLALHLVLRSIIASLLFGLLTLAVTVHCYSWIIPLLRERRRARRRS